MLRAHLNEPSIYREAQSTVLRIYILHIIQSGANKYDDWRFLPSAAPSDNSTQLNEKLITSQRALEISGQLKAGADLTGPTFSTFVPRKKQFPTHSSWLHFHVLSFASARFFLYMEATRWVTVLRLISLWAAPFNCCCAANALFLYSHLFAAKMTAPHQLFAPSSRLQEYTRRWCRVCCTSWDTWQNGAQWDAKCPGRRVNFTKRCEN